jgi:uncharacterized protein YtpQ (UPF0354 family)
MRRLLSLIIAVASPISFAQGTPTDEEAFTKLAAERVSRELPEYNVKPAGKLTLEGKRADGESTGQLSLDRVHAFCARNAQNCNAALDQYARGMGEAVKERNRPIEQSMVRLAIRPAAYVEQIRKQIGADGGAVYFKPVAPGLMAIAVIDFTRAVRFVNDKDLAKLALTEEDLLRLGEKNLRSNAKPLSEVAPIPTANSFGRITGEDYAASRIIFHDDWREMNAKLNNKLVVSLPAPNVLLYGDGSTAVGVEALRAFAADVARKSSRPLSPILLQWAETGWQEFRSTDATPHDKDVDLTSTYGPHLC